MFLLIVQFAYYHRQQDDIRMDLKKFDNVDLKNEVTIRELFGRP